MLPAQAQHNHRFRSCFLLRLSIIIGSDQATVRSNCLRALAFQHLLRLSIIIGSFAQAQILISQSKENIYKSSLFFIHVKEKVSNDE